MRTWRFRFLLIITGLWFDWLLITTLAPEVALAQGPIQVLEEFPINISTNSFVLPDISGDRVIFARNNSIYGYNLATQTEFRITEQAVFPSGRLNISSNILIWEDRRHGNSDIYGYDLNQKREFRLTQNNAHQKWPVIDGNIVVWVDWRHGGQTFGNNIYGYDLVNGKEFRITQHSVPATCPAISKGVVVWSDQRSGTWQIYSYDISSGIERQITQVGTPSPSCPAIDDGVIVFFHEDYIISGVNLLGKPLFNTFIPYPSFNVSLAIDGNLLVWSQRLGFFCVPIGSCSNLSGYDIEAKYKFTITKPGHNPTLPMISDNVVVWRENGDPIFSPYSFSISISKLLETARLQVNPTHISPGNPLTYTLTLADATLTGTTRSITNRLSSDVTLDPASLLVTSGSYDYNPATHDITWTGHVSSVTPVTITYRVQTDPAVTFGQYLTNTAVISDETTIFTRLSTALVARRTYLPTIVRRPHNYP